MYSNSRAAVFSIILIAISAGVSGQASSPFDLLLQKVRSEPDPKASAEIAEKLVDCSYLGEDADKETELQGSEYTQWIYNGLYVWRLIPADDGACVYLSIPEKRGLDIEDAVALLIAHNREFPFPNEDSPSNPVGPDPNAIQGPYPESFLYEPGWPTGKSNSTDENADCINSEDGKEPVPCPGSGPGKRT